MLEVASWAARQGLAEAAILPLPCHFERPDSLAVVRRFADARPDRNRFVRDDGSLSPEVEEALTAVGGRFIEKLIELRPHVVGRRVEAGEMEEVKRFVRAVRLFSEAEIVLGGPTATSHPKEVLAESGADYLFAGEAEETFSAFLRLSWERNSRDRAAEIPGLAFRYGGSVFHNTLPADGYERTALDLPGPAAEVRRCLRDAIRPIASREVVGGNRLDWSLLEGFSREFESLYFTGGRGCPGVCAFCAKLHGQEVRVKSARQLLEEIEGADARIADGGVRVGRWELFQHVDDAGHKHRRVSWAAVFDEDFFLDRRRAAEFFRLWDESPLRDRYRLSVQTNPLSLLDSSGRPHAELFRWIDRVKPMIQLGAESFHAGLLRRWRKRHTVEQLRTALEALDATRQDYSVFILLTDFDSTPEEVIEALRLLALEAFRRRRMRIASSAFTIPLYESDTRKLLEYGGRLEGRVRHFTDFETPQPGWLDPLAAGVADAADAELRFALNLPERDGALLAAMAAVVDRLQREEAAVKADSGAGAARRSRVAELLRHAQWAREQIQEAQFRPVDFAASRASE